MPGMIDRRRVLGWLGMEPLAWVSEPKGIITLIGNGLGLDIPSWAAGPSLALCVIILLSIWSFVGYNTVIYLAGLGNIPKELTEAAEIDGASKWQVFRHITFPLLSPTTYFLSLLAVIGTFKAFNTIWVMREGAALGTNIDRGFALVCARDGVDFLSTHAKRRGYPPSVTGGVLFKEKATADILELSSCK